MSPILIGVLFLNMRRSYNIADTMTVYVWGLPTDLYLGLNTLSSDLISIYGWNNGSTYKIFIKQYNEVTINLNNSVPSRKFLWIP